MVDRGEYQVKKNLWGPLNQTWVEPDVRDEIVETMTHYTQKTQIPIKRLLRYLGLARSKYYEWQRRYGIPNHHNGKIPKATWLFEHGSSLTVGGTSLKLLY